MKTGTGRRFTIFDCMALTAAVAVGLELARTLLLNLLSPNRVIFMVFFMGVPSVALPTTYMLTFLRFFGAKTSRRRLFRPPGVAACMTVTIVSLCLLLLMINYIMHAIVETGGMVPSSRWWPVIGNVLNPQILAASVVASWTLMALNRRWKPEPSWIDRAGRLMGLYWIATGSAVTLVHLWYGL